MTAGGMYKCRTQQVCTDGIARYRHRVLFMVFSGFYDENKMSYFMGKRTVLEQVKSSAILKLNMFSKIVLQAYFRDHTYRSAYWKCFQTLHVWCTSRSYISISILKMFSNIAFPAYCMDHGYLSAYWKQSLACNLACQGQCQLHEQLGAFRKIFIFQRNNHIWL